MAERDKIHVIASEYASARQDATRKYRAETRNIPYTVLVEQTVWLAHYEGFKDGMKAVVST